MYDSMLKARNLLATLLFSSLFATQGFSHLHAADATAPTHFAPFDFTHVAKKATPAVVSVKTKSKVQDLSESGTEDHFFDERFLERFFGVSPKAKRRESSGYTHQASGFFISAEGHIITNAHVVRDTDSILVQLHDGREFQAKEVGQDPNTDIAVIKVEGENFPFLEFGDSLKAEVGQWVAAIGNPFGLRASLTAGVVSALSRSDLDLNSIEDFIQTDAAMNRGNSGGPLLDLSGRVLGMNTALASHTGGYMGIGFAIPSQMLSYVSQQLIKTGKVTRGYLGVVLQPVTHELALALGLQKVEGALVAEVRPGGPAERAGLKRGDLILQYNQHVVESGGALRTAIAFMAPETPVTLKVLRNKQPIELKAIISQFPDSEGFILDGTGTTRSNILGIQVEALTEDLAKKMGLIGYEGVLISNITKGTMSSWLGLAKGTLIMEVNGQPITSVEDFNKAVVPIKKGDNVLMLVREDNITHYVTFKA